jgi:hypothetical protein
MGACHAHGLLAGFAAQGLRAAEADRRARRANNTRAYIPDYSLNTSRSGVTGAPEPRRPR